jgi:hypothetical protein
MRKSVHSLGLALVLFVFANTSQALPPESVATVSPERPASQNTVVVYPAPADIQASNLYGVQVTAGNASADLTVRNTSAQSSFVYEVENQWPGISTELTNSWTSFDFTGSVTVQVQLTLPASQQPFAAPAAVVLPSHAHIKATLETTAPGVYLATFTIHHPGQFAVDFYDQASDPFDEVIPPNPMLIFANAPVLNVPNPKSPSVIYLTPSSSIPASIPAGDILYFSPGVYDLGTTSYPLGSNQGVYIAGGAYVKGAFIGENVQNSELWGHGILSGENFHRNGAVAPTLADSVADGTPPMIYLPGGQTHDILIEGITCIQSPFYNFELGGSDNRIKDAKAIAWYGSTDGVQVAYDSLAHGIQVPGHGLIEDSFFKTGDDAIKLFSSGLRVNRCVIWKLNNAAAFEFGANIQYDLSDIQVNDSDVIRTEYTVANKTNAVFGANFGGTGNLHDYQFNDIRVENATWQLFNLCVMPNSYTNGNPELGSIGNLSFNRIEVTNQQTLPDLFQSFDRQHQIKNISFNQVRVAGHLYPPAPYPTSSDSVPRYTYNANRLLSLAGNTISDPLWRQGESDNFQVWLMSLNGAAGTPQYQPVTLALPTVTGSQQAESIGDFYGTGVAGILFQDTATGGLVIAHELNLNSPNAAPASASAKISPLTYHSQPYSLPTGWAVAGTGDFNGDGYTDVLIWNQTSQRGKILILQGNIIAKIVPVTPPTKSDWRIAGIGDFDQNGCSDILFRDSTSDLEILYFDPTVALTSTDYPQSTLYYSSTSYYEKTYNGGQQKTGTIDSSWTVAGVGNTNGNGYAGILWQNPTTGDVVVTSFESQFPIQQQYGQLFGNTALQIQALGDYNGNGPVNLLLRDTNSGQTSLWYMAWYGGNLFQPGPIIQPSLDLSWLVQP